MARGLLHASFRTAYRLARWLRRRYTPAGRLALGGLLAAGVFGLDTRQTLAFQLAALLASLLVISSLAAVGFRTGWKLRRELPPYGTVGLPCRYAVVLEVQGRRAQQSLLLLDELEDASAGPDDLAAAARASAGRRWLARARGYALWLQATRLRRGADIAAVPLPIMLPGEPVRVEVELVPLRRGYLHFGVTRLLRPDPFGLSLAERRRTEPGRLLVLPRRYPLPRLRLRGMRRYQPGGVSQASSVGDSEEFAFLRDYRPGDPLRQVHWRSTARAGRPVVKEQLDEYFERRALVLDTLAPDVDAESFEAAVSVAASFVSLDWGPDALLDLVFVGPRAVHATSGRGLGGSGHLLELLACAAPCKDRPFLELQGLVLRYAERLSGLIVVLLTLDAPRRDFIRRLEQIGLAPLVLAIGDPGDASGDASPDVHWIPPTRIAEALAGLELRSLEAPRSAQARRA